MDNYITLEHLDQTVWSLIQKNSQLRDEISAVDEKVNNINITESDPIFSASPAAQITNYDISNWNDKPNYSYLSQYYLRKDGYITAGKKSGTSIGDYATAEGSGTTASGYYSHAEGYQTTASNSGAHAEGNSTTASNYYSHAEGSNTTASGSYSHAEGEGTIATTRAQHAFGAYNTEDQGNPSKGWYIEIVGNGTSDAARSNARTLDWSGNEWLAGKLTVGAGPTDDMDVTTKQYVDAAIPTKTSELTNDSGFITSDSDEKLALNTVLVTSKSYYPIFDNSISSAASTKYIDGSYGIAYNLTNDSDNKSVARLELGNSTRIGELCFKIRPSSQYSYTFLRPPQQQDNNESIIYLPSSSGTLALTSQLPTQTSQLTNDSGYLTAAPVTSVNGKTGAVSLMASDVGVDTSKFVVSESSYVPPANLDYPTYYNTSSIAHSQGRIILQNNWFNDGVGQIESSIKLTMGTSIFAIQSSQMNTASIRVIADGTSYIHNLATPTADTDAANKAYVDSSIAAIDIPENTDELVKIEKKTNVTGLKYILFGPDSGTTTIMSGSLNYMEADRALNASKGQKLFQLQPGELDLKDGNYYSRLVPSSNLTAARLYELPDASGTIALVSDITNAIAGVTSFNVSVVSTLPTTSIDTHTIYFLSKTGSTNDVYDEYMYINNAWEKIGNTAVDLSGYLRTTDIATWAKAANKPTYTANEVGALPNTTVIPTKLSDLTNDSGYITSIPVTSVNEKTGAVSLTASDVGALPDTTVIPDISGKVDKSGDTMSGKLILNYNSTNGKHGLQFNYSDNYYATIVAHGYTGSSTAYTFVLRLMSGNNSNNGVFLRGIASPSTDTDAANKKYVDDKVAGITIPTKLSELTNDSGYITSYTETDPVFAASAAAGITSTDISNWNAKVSDDKTWNGVSLDKTSQVTNGADFYVPYITATTSTQAKLMPAGDGIVKYRLVSRDGSGYIKSATPAATEHSTIVATTAYVTTAISNIDIPALEPVANVEAMLTSLGLPINTNLTAAAAGTAETGHAVVQEG